MSSDFGDDNGGYGRSSGRDRRTRQSSINYNNPQPRLYLGGKIPNYNHHSYKKSSKSKNRTPSTQRRHFDSSSESSSSEDDIRRNRGRHTSNDGDDDSQFNSYEQKRLHQQRESIQPINADLFPGNDLMMSGSLTDKASKKDLLRADVSPLSVDSRISFDSIGGLEAHIRALKEMILFPLLYPDLFARFNTDPPRGVLFLGPPGTGKTLTARALANSVTLQSTDQTHENMSASSLLPSSHRKISFFMRKGADCLSKWVGEGERQLRLLFEQAKKMQPSIIFFDEIDGLAPVRSAKQDQIHASIVSTLLALMDGLDARGQVVVIGATNRPDAIDPALRRPGRFDRELVFPLPSADARSAILKIQTGILYSHLNNQWLYFWCPFCDLFVFLP